MGGIYYLILDTNVILGYIHKNDRLNSKCKKFFDACDNHKFTYFERLHKDDFNRAIRNRVNQNTTKLTKLGLWDANSDGSYKIKNIDELKKKIEKETLSESDRKWIETILDNTKEIDDIRIAAPKNTALIINDFVKEFNSCIAALVTKNRVQTFHINRASNTDEKNRILDLFNSSTDLKNDFFSKIDEVYHRKGEMGSIDKNLLALSFFCALNFVNNKYMFVTDDGHMKPETDEIAGIFGRLFSINTLDNCIKLLI